MISTWIGGFNVKRKLKKHEWIVALMIILFFINFLFNNSNTAQFQATHQTIVIQHGIILMRFVWLGLLFYFINNELRFEKTLWVYLFGLGSGIILSVWIFAVRVSSSSAFAPFSIFIGEDHALRYVEIIVIVMHVLSVIPLMLTKHYDFKIKIAFLLIIAGQIVFFLSKFDGLTIEESRIFVHAPYLNADVGTYTIIYFLSEGIHYTLVNLLQTLSMGYLVYKLTPQAMKKASQP